MKNLCSLFLLVMCSILALPLQAQQAGELWGITGFGGSDGRGTIFKTAADGTGEMVQYNFSSQFPGSAPQYSQLIETSDGKLYGMTYQGGANALGVLFEYDPSTATYMRKLDFNGWPAKYLTKGHLISLFIKAKLFPFLMF